MDSKSDVLKEKLMALQSSQPLPHIFNLSNTRISVLPEGEEFFVVLYGLGRFFFYVFLLVFTDFYITARKPQAFKPGDEWHPERSQL